jgi:hypothetical protein
MAVMYYLVRGGFKNGFSKLGTHCRRAWENDQHILKGNYYTVDS